MSKPAISIVMPFHNAASTIDEALESIAAQNFESYELVAVNDHSHDGSREHVEKRAASDVRIRVIDNQGEGIVAALNTGLERARAPLIARMDADDRMHPDRLKIQMDYLITHMGLSLVASQVAKFADEKIGGGFREYIDWQNQVLSVDDVRDEIYVESPFAHPSVLFKKAEVLEIGGYRDGHFPEDYELWLRMNAAGKIMAKVPEVLMEWRDSPNRLSRTDERCSPEAFDEIRALYLAQDERLQTDRSLVVWGAGKKSRKRVQRIRDFGHEPSAWIDVSPKLIGTEIDGAAVLDPEWLDKDDKPFVLSYVNNHGARQLIAERLAEYGYERGTDYLMVG